MGKAALSDVLAVKMPGTDRDRIEKEYLALLAIFEKYIDDGADEAARLELFEQFAELRARQAFQYACDGFGITFEDALELLRNADGLSEADSDRRDIIVAAIDNIADFAVVEEYQMASEIGFGDDFDDFEGNEDVEEDEDFELMYEELVAIFAKYNKRYAETENYDIDYAMAVAAQLSVISSQTWLMYMTQGDERVRPWHLQFEGYTAPKSMFPAWLVPPIEHQCRCYLVESEPMAAAPSDVMARTPERLVMPEWFNRTFKESVAFKGRIFSDEHPYFRVNARHADRLAAISERIKSRYIPQ